MTLALSIRPGLVKSAMLRLGLVLRLAGRLEGVEVGPPLLLLLLLFLRRWGRDSFDVRVGRGMVGGACAAACWGRNLLAGQRGQGRLTACAPGIGEAAGSIHAAIELPDTVTLYDAEDERCANEKLVGLRLGARRLLAIKLGI